MKTTTRPLKADAFVSVAIVVIAPSCGAPPDSSSVVRMASSSSRDDEADDDVMDVKGTSSGTFVGTDDAE